MIFTYGNVRCFKVNTYIGIMAHSKVMFNISHKKKRLYQQDVVIDSNLAFTDVITRI
jgi:hypothetical protein